MARPVDKLPPIHPGELLREDLDALGLWARALTEQAEQKGPRNKGVRALFFFARATY